MPTKYKRKPGSRTYKDYTEDSLNICIEELRTGNITQREAEVKYGIPRRTINYKLQHKHQNKVGGQPVFSIEEEKAFVSCLEHLSVCGFPVTTSDLVAVIACYLNKCGRKVSRFKEGVFAGSHWVNGFLGRHHELSMRVAANVKRLRAGLTREMVQEYFINLKNELEDVPATHIFNFDETNLTDDPGQSKIITRRGTKYANRILNSSKSSVSLMFCGSADGDILPPFVVYKSTQLWTTWCQGGPTGTKYNHTPSGWFDGATFTAWIRDLVVPHLRKLPGKKVLIGDNLASHFSISALELLSENDIILICLPPNTTHITQPLDKAVFRPVKGHWRAILLSWKETNTGGKSTTIDKQYFPYLLKKLWDAVTPNIGKNLKAGFESCGIVPIAEDKVMRFVDQPDVDNNSLQASFIEALERKRQEWTGLPKPRKRKRINVIPGKSVDGDAFSIVDEGATTSSAKYPTKKSRQQRKSSTFDEDEENEDEISALMNDSSEDETMEEMAEQFEQEEKEEEEFNTFINSGGSGNMTLKNFNKVVGEYVVVVYEGSFFPGRIEIISSESATVSTMVKTTKAWRWPIPADVLEYNWEDVLGGIEPPKPVNKRGFYSVVELGNVFES